MDLQPRSADAHHRGDLRRQRGGRDRARDRVRHQRRDGQRDLAVQRSCGPGLVAADRGPVRQAGRRFGDYAGDIDTLSLASGALLDQYQTAGYIVASPAETDGNLLIDSTDGFLYDLTPGGGTVAHPSTTISSPSSSHSIANPNGNLTISGSASAGATISSVNVLIQGGGGTWWDSATSSWVAAPYPNRATLGSPGATSTTWQTSMPVPAAGGRL